MLIRILKASALATSALAAITGGGAFAQDASAVAGKGAEDIVVTANRTESRASKTPVTLTAISGDGLRAAGVTQPIALADRVPSLEINRSRGGLNFTVRGVATNDTSEKGDSSTAFLLDGIYIARAAMRDATFFDISRVEVLRGPQGTLYGRNTTAGAIGVITNRPNFQFGGSVDASAANFDTYQIAGAVNVPVSENIALRGAVDYERNGSYLNIGPAVDLSYKKAREVYAGRVSALFKWNSGELVVRGDYAKIGGANLYVVPLANFFATPAGTGIDPVYTGADKSTAQQLALNITSPWPVYRHNNGWGISADLTQELGQINLYYLGSYRELNRDELFTNILSNGINGGRQVTISQDWQQSHELRFSIANPGPFKLQAGTFFFKEATDVIQRGSLGINTSVADESGTTLFFHIMPSAAESYAFFAQGTYSITDSLRATGGIRYTHDKKSRRGFGNLTCTNSFYNCDVAPGTAQTEYSNFASSKTTWKIGFDYDVVPGTMLYASVATGYKAGGFNNGCAIGTASNCTVPAQTLYFRPESLTSYEAGVKARLAGNAVQINASVFHYDYSDLQLTQSLSPCPSTPSNPSSSCSFTTNAGKAKIDGAELEATLLPSERDRVDLSGAYLNARYSDFQILPTLNLAGRALNRAPRWSASAGYEHTFPLGGGYELVAGARTRISGSYVILFLGGANFYRQPSYSKTDVTLTLNAPDKRWYVQGFAKNLEDNVLINEVARGTFQGLTVNEPRTYGVRAGLKF